MQLMNETEDVSWELTAAQRYLRTGQAAKAREVCRHCLKRDPDNPEALLLLGEIAQAAGDTEEAKKIIRCALRRFPQDPRCYKALGLLLRNIGHLDDARINFLKAIDLTPASADAYFDLARTYQLANQLSAAIQCYKKAIQLDPHCQMAFHNLGIIYHTLGQLGEAVAFYRQALSLQPDHATGWCALAFAYQDLDQAEIAVSYWRRALDIDPNLTDAYNGLGLAHRRLKQFAQAIDWHMRGLALSPESDDIRVNIANVYQEAGHYRRAALWYRKALEINSRNPIAHLNLGVALAAGGQAEMSTDHYRKALQSKPDYAKACAYLVGRLLHECDWEELDSVDLQLDKMTRDALKKGELPAETPFTNLARHADPVLNGAVARAWSRNISNRIDSDQRPFVVMEQRRAKQKITVGYLSNNYRNHPTAQLILKLFELHNRETFTVNGYSYGVDDGSHYRERIKRTCDRFVDLRQLDHYAAAGKIYDDGVDILIELAGHTEGNRLEICAMRPAPIQVRYLGMAGTTGAEFIDYLITDSTVTPPEHAPYYSERFVYMPDCYQINSFAPQEALTNRQLPDFELPPNGFVFCCFNAAYKIDRIIFDSWMNILNQIPNSILWLLEPGRAARSNLKRSAAKKGVDPARLLFAPKMAKIEHLNRMCHADLALDTKSVSGAATTSDALWAGIPVVTLQGEHFASRMSSSILAAAGLPELVTVSLAEYERCAVQLARNPDRLHVLKSRLNRNRWCSPLFDTPAFVSHLESAYMQMKKWFHDGRKPRAFKISDLI